MAPPADEAPSNAASSLVGRAARKPLDRAGTRTVVGSVSARVAALGGSAPVGRLVDETGRHHHRANGDRWASTAAVGLSGHRGAPGDLRPRREFTPARSEALP